MGVIGLWFMMLVVTATGTIASRKHRNVGAWIGLGVLFPVISLIIIASLGPTPAPALGEGQG